jgi:MFS family permease
MSLRPDAHVTHELLPREGLGAFFAKRLFWATALSCIGTLLAGIVIDQWRFEEKLHAYPVTQRGCAVSRCVSAAADAVLAQYRDDALVTSQVANAVVLYIWGRLSDRLSNKAILRVALPLYFVCMLGLAFAAIPMRAASRSPCCTSCTSPWVPPPAAAVSRRAT